MDQAEGLRRFRDVMNDPDAEDPFHLLKKDPENHGPRRVISVTSGKGGVGKTNVVANLAFALTQMGKRVLVLDADLGLANIDVLLGLTPRYTIEHFFSRKKALHEILVEGPGGMTIMPASSGVLDLVNLTESQKLFLLNEVDGIAEKVDVLLIDTGAGISSNVLYFNMAAQESIVIATPEPTSITDAYALIKLLSTRYQKKDFMMLVNQVADDHEAREVYEKISKVADRFLGSLSIDYLGFIPYDQKLPSAVKHQRPVLEIYPKAASSKGFTELAKSLSEKPFKHGDHGGIQFFLKQLLQAEHSLCRNGGIA
jgi:flagellar biosynthesis protein FlhG